MVTSTEPAPSSVPPIIHVNNASLVPLYACASGRVKTLLDGSLKIETLLDNGSEVNLMPCHVFEHLGLPIDTNIAWRINMFNTGSETKAHGCLGVCHAVPVDIGGVEIAVPVLSEGLKSLFLSSSWRNQIKTYCWGVLGNGWHGLLSPMRMMEATPVGSSLWMGIGLFNLLLPKPIINGIDLL